VVLVPVAFFPRTGIDAYAPLATVIIGGLTVGTVLALFVVPVLHTYTDDLARLVRSGFGRLTPGRESGAGKRAGAPRAEEETR
jgi:hydrophobic/amphiphilic exporter-1 (mainly G- bacteria), HAE1 family